MNEVISRFGLSARRVCRLTGWNRSSLQYEPKPSDDGPLRDRMLYWATRKLRWGSPLLHDVLKAEGLYREQGLCLRRKRRKKLPACVRVPLAQATAPNQHWSMDFVHDQLASGRCFRCRTLVDDFTRQCLALYVDTSIGGEAVVGVLKTLARVHGLPKVITTDNSPEFTGKALHLWA